MQVLRDYVLGIAAAAMICSITLCFAGKGATEPLLKLISGLVLTFAIVSPILKISMGKWEDLGIDIRADAGQAVQEGKDQAVKTVRGLIKEETQSYILDKAQALHLDISVTVELSDQALPVPTAATVTGTVPPYAKAQLSRMMTQELGIAKENQQWIS